MDTKAWIINFYKTKLENIDAEIATLKREKVATQRKFGKFIARKLDWEYVNDPTLCEGMCVGREGMMFVVDSKLKFQPLLMED